MIREEYFLGNDGLERAITIDDQRVVSRLRCVGEDAPSSRDYAHLWWRTYLRGEPIRTRTTRQISIVDLFSGVGGLSLGADQAVRAIGCEPIFRAAVDVDQDALNVYARHFGTSFTSPDNVLSLVDYHINGRHEAAHFAYEPEIVDERFERLVGNVDLVLAGPPCQGHSTLNNHTRHDDPRNDLYLTAVAAAVALRAEMIVVENVPAVLRDRKKVVLTAKTILERAGYEVSDGKLDGTKLGAPQTRSRHFLVATRQPHSAVVTTAKTLQRPPMSLFDAIGDLEEAEGCTVFDSAPLLSAENQRRIAYLFDNDAYDLPNEERPDCHKNGHTYPSVYGRLRWSEPAPTITGGFMSPGRGRFIHPSRRRVLTPHEAARIQGFPDGFSFDSGGEEPSRKLLAKWIGDAVPSQLGYVATLAAITSRFQGPSHAPADEPIRNYVQSSAKELVS